MKTWFDVHAARKVVIGGVMLFMNLETAKADGGDTSPISTLEVEKNLTMKVSAYLQARLEYGDLVHGKERKMNASDGDIYFRRARVGFSGAALLPGLSYGLSFAADQSTRAEIYSSYESEITAGISDAYLRYKLSDQVTVKFAKDKLPYSRIYLTSSSEQLFSERPFYTYALRDHLHVYTHTHLSVIGQVLDKTLTYSLAIGKAWRPGDRLTDGAGPVVVGASPELVARIEWSPRDWIESHRSDAHLGKGRHLSLGLFGSVQNALRSETSAGVAGSERRPWFGTDASYHDGNVSMQAEFNTWSRSGAGQSHIARAVYVQGAYFLAGHSLEPAVRLERFTQRTSGQIGSADVLTVGINKYIEGHDLKVTLDMERTWFSGGIQLLRPDEKATRDVLRLTTQWML